MQKELDRLKRLKSQAGVEEHYASHGVSIKMIVSPARHFARTLLIVMYLAVAQKADNGRTLFHQMQDAIGGAEKIAAVKDYEALERAETWFEDGRSRGIVHKRVRFIRPGYLRIDQVGPGDSYVLYFDGKTGWEIPPDKSAVVPLEKGELRFAQSYLNGLNLNSWLNDRDLDLVFTSPSPNIISIAVRGDSAHVNQIILDPATHLPLGGKGISLADPDHPVSSEAKLEQWEIFGGIKFPRKITNIHGGKRLAQITVEKIKLDSGLKPADLALKPADLKPVMSR